MKRTIVRSRRAALEGPAPRGWVPREGDLVWIPDSLTASGVVATVNKAYVLVKYAYGYGPKQPRRFKKAFHVSQIRPCLNEKGEPVSEREA